MNPDTGRFILHTPKWRRFMRRVWIGDGCWEWFGARDTNGYGKYGITWAHRAAYEFANGTIPKDLIVLHSCDNRRCVRPDHLSLGTYKDNAADAVSRGRLARGSKSGVAKLTEDEVRSFLNSDEPARSVADRLKVHPRTIRDIRRGRTWRHV